VTDDPGATESDGAGGPETRSVIDQPSLGAEPPVDPAGLRFVSLADEPELAEVATAIERDLPPFLAELTRAHRDRATAHFASTSWVVLEADLPVGVVRAVPWSWSGASAEAPVGGVGEVAVGIGSLEAGAADTLAVLDVVVAFGARGRGIGRAVLQRLDLLRAEHALDRLLVLLRPHTKHDYPLVPFQRYASFVRDDGAPFDPWFRAAWQTGLVPVAAAERSLSARAPFDSWQRWLGVEVPGSGPYLVDGAIKPAILETELDEGRYREPHLWVGSGAAVSEVGGQTWLEALEAAGVVAGDRQHREVKRRR
jgi:GNAT superfamily N-acetyltransferase